jgi:molybdopterin converting factor subunit 1
MAGMQVRVLFFGRLKEIVGRAEDRVELAEGACVEDVFARYGGQHPELTAFRASLVASVNQEFAPWTAPVRAGDEIAFLPPVSGGAGVEVAADIIELVRAPIRAEEIVRSLKAPEDGAVVTFDGIVRNHSGGRATLFLEYEAYEPMALRKMREIAGEMRNKFAIDRLAMVHRLGRLEIGETSVLIAVSAAHRRAAFDACRYAIDTLKRTVPIWKKEYFAGGAVWVEGEIPAAAAEPAAKPFPAPDESES